MIKKYLILIAIVFTANIYAFSQSVTNSPYTRFGIGDIDRNGFNNSKAMGGISTGLRVKNQINYLNPAAISAQDTLSFIFDVGLTGITKTLETNTQSIEFKNFSFDHIAISFPIRRWWFAGLGITPYSKIGYNFKQTEPHVAIDTINIVNLNSGEGGLNQVFFSNSFNLFDNLSVGLNINYLFGSLEQYRQTNIEDDYSGNATIIKDRVYLNKFSFDMGVQYYNTFNTNYFYNIGLSYSNKINFKGNKVNTVFSSPVYDTKQISIKDYLNKFSSTLDTIKHSSNNNYSVTLPSKFSVGFTAGIIDKLTVGVDYSFQDWSKVSSIDVNELSTTDQVVDFSNDQTINLGLEYIPQKNSYKNYLLRINYRAGFYYNKSYLKILDNQINNYGITFGLGLPMANKKTSLNLSCVIGKRGTMNDGLIEENFTSFGFNFTLYDFWFYKRKIQ